MTRIEIGSDVTLVGQSGAAALLEKRVARRNVAGLMATGLLGPRFRHGSSLLVMDSEVERVTALPDVDAGAVCSAVGPIFVTRQTARTAAVGDKTRTWLGVDVFAPTNEQIAATDRWYVVGEDTRAAMEQRIATEGFIPLVSTVSGLVAQCRDIVGTTVDEGKVRLITRGGGRWARDVLDRWMATGPGGPWIWHV